MIWLFGAIAFVVYGLLHVLLGSFFLGMNLFGPADAFVSGGIPADTSAHARALMKENNVMLIASSFWVLVLALRSWNHPGAHYKTMVGVSSVGTLSFLFFELVPGHVPWSQGGLSVVLWAAAVALCTAGKGPGRPE